MGAYGGIEVIYLLRGSVIYAKMVKVLAAFIRGDIAQLARAPALQAGGPGFESLCLHHVWGESGFGLRHSTKILLHECMEDAGD